MARAAARAARTAKRPPRAETQRSLKAHETSGLAARLGIHSRRDALTFLGLALLVWGCYFPALSAGFVWDDVIFLEEPVVLQWSGLWDIWFSPGDLEREGHYWPLVYTSFWLEHKLWGLAPLGSHLVNVALHFANTVLVWRLLAKLVVPGAWAIAAVFAVHPLHVESVAWVIERKDLLSGLFYLAAVLVWIRFTEAQSAKRYCLALGLYAAALLSKSIAVTLPAALLIWHWWQMGRITNRDMLRLVPFFALGLAVSLADMAFYFDRELTFDLGLSWLDRVLIASRALWFYAGKLALPTDLAVIYPLWEIRANDLIAWAYVVAALMVPMILWLFRDRIGRGPLAGAAFFAVTLSPVLGFVDYGYMQYAYVADRFQYLAGIGVIAVAVGVAALGVMRLGRELRTAAVCAFALVLAAFGSLTWRQSAIWHDGVTLFSHVVAINPVARNAHLNLSSALLGANRPEKAYEAALVGIEQRPQMSSAHVHLGHVLLRLERFEEAEASLEEALALKPGNQRAWHNLGQLRHRQERHEEAVEWFDKAATKNPDNFLAVAGRGVSLHHLGRHAEAFRSMELAFELAPGSPDLDQIHLWAGRALRALGRLDEAAARFRQSAQAYPEDGVPLIELASVRLAQGRQGEANALRRQATEVSAGDAQTLQIIAEKLRGDGLYAEAIESYREVLAIDAEFAMAHAGMGDALFRLERHEEALAALGQSVELHPIPPTATARLVLMGMAAEHLGRHEEAASHFERAVEMDPQDGEALDRLAAARFAQERHEEAADLFRASVEVQPDHAPVHANLGATLYHLGRFEESLKSYERALALDPQDEEVRTSVEGLRQRLGMP